MPYTIAKIKKIVAIPNTGEDRKKLSFSYIVGGNIKLYGHSGKYFGSCLKN